jgi:hypothetical protein
MIDIHDRRPLVFDAEVGFGEQWSKTRLMVQLSDQ